MGDSSCHDYGYDNEGKEQMYIQAGCAMTMNFLATLLSLDHGYMIDNIADRLSEGSPESAE